MSDSLITTRAEFLRVLDATTAEIDAFVAREPLYPVWKRIQVQLHAMKQWATSAAGPTPEQLQMVSIGLIAARELEPAPDAAIDDLVSRLHNLNYAWRRWPLSG
ncbi:hypothetical protein [Polyangium aurulentum]|uniref:hypothetical protein n=1 Tax=Polyangium aurulentum TaxID=2567896 RepID=UPI0010AE0C21|nr:hypothetical protein [Polyangium aurulentum]UQA56372.1 hypothetical protein E8A73_034400 [Polyangium aurulentum]